MNKLVIPNGGMPLFGDDFNFMDAAARDAIKGLLYDIVQPYNGSLILGGCVLSISGGFVTVTPGYVMIDYEVRYFPGITFPAFVAVGGQMAPDDLFDPAGLKTFANSSSQNTYQIRRAQFIPNNDVADGPLDYNSPDLTRLSKAINLALLGQIQGSTAVSYSNGWSAEVANTPLLKKALNQVQFYGGMLVGSINQVSFTKVATLPPGFRPSRRFKTIVAAFGIGVYGSVMMEFFTDGEVHAIAVDGNAYDLVSLNVAFVV